MKKIGIVTLNGLYNYGNRLQNYALQHKLEELGFAVETIVSHEEHILHPEPVRKKTNFVKKSLDIIVSGKLIERLNHKATFEKMIALKAQANQSFNQKDVHIFDVTKEKITDIQALNQRYDYFVVGSDQVWNPFFVQDYRLNFLTFADPEKMTAYAASFGVAQIDHKLADFYKQNLARFKKITVREQQGQVILKELLDKEFPMVLDPTLLLSQKEWQDIIAAESIPLPQKKQNYLLLYFIKDMAKEHRRIVEAYAQSQNLEIVQIMGDIYNANYVVPNPKEFIRYIQQAAFVFTDSFHATVFSITMGTPFFIFSRQDIDMSSRVDTLLKLLALERHADLESLKKLHALTEMDNQLIVQTLEKQRAASLEQLANFFN